MFWLPTLLRSDDGRSASFTSFGGLRRLEIDGLSLLLYPASELESGLAGIWLRLLDGAAAVPLPLLDPATEASSYVDGESYRRAGVWRDLEWQTSFSFPADGPSWRWQISVRNRGTEAVRMDTVHAADIALAPYSAVRCNEYFVSQYLDITPLSTSTHGTCLAVRQNMPGPRVPWVLLGSATGAAGWATDALQLSGCPGEPALTGLRSATLPNARLQHEHTLATLASEPVLLEPGETWDGGYFGCFVADHPAASFAADAALTGLAGAVIPLDAPTTDPLEPSPRNLFAAAPVASWPSSRASDSGDGVRVRGTSGRPATAAIVASSWAAASSSRTGWPSSPGAMVASRGTTTPTERRSPLSCSGGPRRSRVVVSWAIGRSLPSA